MKRKALALTLMLACSFSAVVGSQFVNLAAANFLQQPPLPQLPHATIRSDGSIEPQTLSIKRDEDIYIVTGNIFNYTLEIQRNNIAVDGASYVLQGDGSGTGILITNRTGITIKNLKIQKFATGIAIEQSSNNTIIKNNIASNDLGIVLYRASNNCIVANQIEANGQAILFYESANHNTIAENNITKNGNGIWCEHTNPTSNNNSIVGNNITEDGSNAILLRSSSNNRIEGNNIKNNENGILLDGFNSQYNSLTGNTIANNKYAMQLTGQADHSVIMGNTIANNEYGIRLFSVNNSEIYHNDFVNNTCQAFIELSMSTHFSHTFVNSWDNGSFSGGNFWSDYNGTDNNGDGMGDSPYMIETVCYDYDLGKNVTVQEGEDNFPLMAPMDAPNPSPSPSQSSSPQETEPFPTALVVASMVSVAIIGIGSLIFFKKRRRDKNP
jgi:parallel beta-helix repeat protein